MFIAESRIQQGTLSSMGDERNRLATDGNRRRHLQSPTTGSMGRHRRRNILGQLRHIFVQPGPVFGSVRRRRLLVELQLFLVQQEIEADRVFHLQG